MAPCFLNNRKIVSYHGEGAYGLRARLWLLIIPHTWVFATGTWGLEKKLKTTLMLSDYSKSAWSAPLFSWRTAGRKSSYITSSGAPVTDCWSGWLGLLESIDHGLREHIPHTWASSNDNVFQYNFSACSNCEASFRKDTWLANLNDAITVTQMSKQLAPGWLSAFCKVRGRINRTVWHFERAFQRDLFLFRPFTVKLMFVRV